MNHIPEISLWSCTWLSLVLCAIETCINKLENLQSHNSTGNKLTSKTNCSLSTLEISKSGWSAIHVFLLKSARQPGRRGRGMPPEAIWRPLFAISETAPLILNPGDSPTHLRIVRHVQNPPSSHFCPLVPSSSAATWEGQHKLLKVTDWPTCQTWGTCRAGNSRPGTGALEFKELDSVCMKIRTATVTDFLTHPQTVFIPKDCKEAK